LPEADTDRLTTFPEDRALLVDTVRKAGAIAREHFYANESEVWDKGENNPVTDADIAVNEFLHAVLQKARPDYGWLSEETRDDYSRHDRKRSFVVDPIDGTRAFIDRSPNFTVSVAVIEDGLSVAAALYNPLKDEMFDAHRGGGALLNGKAISATDRTNIDGITMVGYPRKFRRLGWPDMQCEVVNSMAYRMARVAASMADATVAFTPKSDWDIAAAELIATEAGAVVTNLAGAAPRYDTPTVTGHGIICAGPTLHALLLERVKPVLDQFIKSRDKEKDFGFMGTRMSDREKTPVQLLHLVIGGELMDPNKTTFKDLSEVDFVGAYPDYASARAAWKSAAQRTVDNAHMRYFVLHAHELIDPDKDGIIG